MNCQRGALAESHGEGVVLSGNLLNIFKIFNRLRQAIESGTQRNTKFLCSSVVKEERIDITLI